MQDLTGKRFGRWTVLGFSHHQQMYFQGKKNGRWRFWLCLCDCGNEYPIKDLQLIRGKSKSCGCLTIEKRAEQNRKPWSRRAWYCWYNMMARCHKQNNPMYKYYGERGIKVCGRWHDFENFYADMGEPPEGYWLERIDNDAGYSPKNCTWATPKEQAKNKRTDNYGKHCKGESHPMAKLSEKDVVVIKRQYTHGATREYLARKYNIHKSHIDKILRGKSWSSVEKQ